MAKFKTKTMTLKEAKEEYEKTKKPYNFKSGKLKGRGKKEE